MPAKSDTPAKVSGQAKTRISRNAVDRAQGSAASNPLLGRLQRKGTKLQFIQIEVPVDVQYSASEIEIFKGVFPDVAKLMLERRELNSQQHQDQFIANMAQSIPLKPINMKLARLKLRALRSVYTGTQWLTSEEVGTLGGHGKANPGAAAHRWKTKGQLFCIRQDGKDRYPRYAFADDFTPLPAVQVVLSIFEGWDPMRIASWFESTSSFLSGKRPRELIASHPQRAIESAKDAVMQLHA